MKIVFSGGSTAGLIGLLTLRALGHEVTSIATRDPSIVSVADMLFHIPCVSAVNKTHRYLREADLFVNVHGRDIVTDEELMMPRHGGFNVHPCLSLYKGKDPVGRFLADGRVFASVGGHIMTSNIDDGPVLTEWYHDVSGMKTREEVYNRIYYLYPEVIWECLYKLCE